MAGISEQQPRKEQGQRATQQPSARENGSDVATLSEPNGNAPAASNAARGSDAKRTALHTAVSPVDDMRFMRRAIELAWRGAGWTNPNPLVGCVLVRNGRIIGEGWHARFGQAHAERNALADCARHAKGGQGNAFAHQSAGESAEASPADPACGTARGATAYVTLEPCCHTGKQPPCTKALIAAGVGRVVVGSRDPNPLVSGGGVAALRAAGIHVDTDVLRSECDQLNPMFFHFITTSMPYVVAKWAMSADGKIACASGDAEWVTGPEARADGHELRHRLAAIAVGIGTVLADDPLLTCRRNGAASSQPVRVVLDSHLRIPEDCALVRSCAEGTAPLVVATCANVSDPASDAHAKAGRLAARGVEVLHVVQDANGRVSVRELLRALGKRGIDSVLVEGGTGIHGAFFDEGLVNEAVAYIAPKVVGGTAAPSPVDGAGAARMSDAVALGRAASCVLGDDVKLSFAPAGAARVSGQTPASRKTAGAPFSAAQGGAPCSPAS